MKDFATGTNIKLIREVYQEYDTFIIWNVYRVVQKPGAKKQLIYRECENKTSSKLTKLNEVFEGKHDRYHKTKG